MNLLPLLALVLLALPVSAVTLDWVPIANPGNACDPQQRGCLGAVPYAYQMSRYEVTNAQYTAFLNAVAATDTHGLYDPGMASAIYPDHGGITRSGISGSFVYTAIAGREDLPVNFVSYYDSLRFANWLQNGQPSGIQDATTTESGAYSFSGTTTVGARNPGAVIVLPTENEWYKAAYYDAVSQSYFDYPALSDIPTACTAPGATANTANCINVVGDFTPVGSYTGSAGPNGTYDQGGNVIEWTETLVTISGTQRSVVLGGSFVHANFVFHAANRLEFLPTAGYFPTGFRLAMVPEPGTGLLLAGGLLALGWRVRRRG